MIHDILTAVSKEFDVRADMILSKRGSQKITMARNAFIYICSIYGIRQKDVGYILNRTIPSVSKQNKQASDDYECIAEYRGKIDYVINNMPNKYSNNHAVISPDVAKWMRENIDEDLSVAFQYIWKSWNMIMSVSYTHLTLPTICSV